MVPKRELSAPLRLQPERKEGSRGAQGACGRWLGDCLWLLTCPLELTSATKQSNIVDEGSPQVTGASPAPAHQITPEKKGRDHLQLHSPAIFGRGINKMAQLLLLQILAEEWRVGKINVQLKAVYG